MLYLGWTIQAGLFLWAILGYLVVFGFTEAVITYFIPLVGVIAWGVDLSGPPAWIFWGLFISSIAMIVKGSRD